MPLVLGAAILAAAMLAPPALAQSAGGDKPSVEINLGVLDKIEPHRGAAVPRIVLRPPRAHRPRKKRPQVSVGRPAGGAAAGVPRLMVAPPRAKAAPSKPPAKTTQGEKQPPAAASPKPLTKPQTASLPPVRGTVQQTARIPFEGDSVALPPSAPDTMKAMVAVLTKDERTRLVIYAFAKGDKRSPGRARRVALSRALSIRRYLIENGVRGTRAEIRAMGDKTRETPIDRVDLVLLKR